MKTTAEKINDIGTYSVMISETGDEGARWWRDIAATPQEALEVALFWMRQRGYAGCRAHCCVYRGNVYVTGGTALIDEMVEPGATGELADDDLPTASW